MCPRLLKCTPALGPRRAGAFVPICLPASDHPWSGVDIFASSCLQGDLLAQRRELAPTQRTPLLNCLLGLTLSGQRVNLGASLDASSHSAGSTPTISAAPVRSSTGPHATPSVSLSVARSRACASASAVRDSRSRPARPAETRPHQRPRPHWALGHEHAAAGRLRGWFPRRRPPQPNLSRFHVSESPESRPPNMRGMLGKVAQHDVCRVQQTRFNLGPGRGIGIRPQHAHRLWRAVRRVIHRDLRIADPKRFRCPVHDTGKVSGTSAPASSPYLAAAPLLHPRHTGARFIGPVIPSQTTLNGSGSLLVSLL